MTDLSFWTLPVYQSAAREEWKKSFNSKNLDYKKVYNEVVKEQDNIKKLMALNTHLRSERDNERVECEQLKAAPVAPTLTEKRKVVIEAEAWVAFHKSVNKGTLNFPVLMNHQLKLMDEARRATGDPEDLREERDEDDDEEQEDKKEGEEEEEEKIDYGEDEEEADINKEGDGEVGGGDTGAEDAADGENAMKDDHKGIEIFHVEEQTGASDAKVNGAGDQAEE